ncbi:hypothetical protein G9F72_021465 [Clostridium estertheticum]|uniref:hypothetical protein n=1 Tax=Clostridium estertheticum TaxID=238834 RepID=UPI0013E904CD|nr:hypothetical protein [Clostridium estertheticum]MBZ9688891.1 hypothetical protein [Clostridium estertheticum]
MRKKKILCAALVIAALSTISAMKTYAASAAMPDGTVVIGSKAFDLSYVNDPKNLTEISSLIVAGGGIYVKGFNKIWIDNTTGKALSASSIPSVTYTDNSGVVTKYAAGDIIDSATASTLEVISIE